MTNQGDNERNNYFSGKMLKEDDLRDEQSYSRERRWCERCRKLAPLGLAVLGSAVALGIIYRRRRRASE